jgi:phosphatidylglycerol:prolipoprotein diacylglycerol transferase
VVGARLMYVVHYWNQFRSRGTAADVFIAAIDIRKGGVEYYGGFVLVILGVLYYLWRWKHSIRWYLDIVAPSAAMGLAIGRIGCLLNGCCYGNVCDAAWHIRFPHGSVAMLEQWQRKAPGLSPPEELILRDELDGPGRLVARESLAASDAEIAASEKAEAELRPRLDVIDAALKTATDPAERRKLNRERDQLRRELAARAPCLDLVAQMRKYNLTAAQMRARAAQSWSLPVHPTQVYSTITAGLIALLLNSFYYRRTRDGQVICLLFLIEPISRMLIEMLRADNPQDQLGLTISQKIAIGLTVCAAVGFVLLRFLPVRSPRAVIWTPQEDEQVGRRKLGVAS